MIDISAMYEIKLQLNYFKRQLTNAEQLMYFSDDPEVVTLALNALAKRAVEFAIALKTDPLYNNK